MTAPPGMASERLVEEGRGRDGWLWPGVVREEMLATNQTRTRHDPLYIKFPAQGPSGVSVGHNTGSLAIFFFTPSPVQPGLRASRRRTPSLVDRSKRKRRKRKHRPSSFCSSASFSPFEPVNASVSVRQCTSRSRFCSLLRRCALGHSNSLFSWTSLACELSSRRLPSELVMCLQVY